LYLYSHRYDCSASTVKIDGEADIGYDQQNLLNIGFVSWMAREMFSKIKLLDTAIHSKTSSSNKTMKCLLFLKI
jgi:hypothetical protein